MLGRVDEMTVNAQRRTGWILLCLPFVISLATSAAVSVCGARRITTLNVAHVYVQSFEGSCSRISCSSPLECSRVSSSQAKSTSSNFSVGCSRLR